MGKSDSDLAADSEPVGVPTSSEEDPRSAPGDGLSDDGEALPETEGGGEVECDDFFEMLGVGMGFDTVPDALDGGCTVMLGL